MSGNRHRGMFFSRVPNSLRKDNITQTSSLMRPAYEFNVTERHFFIVLHNEHKTHIVFVHPTNLLHRSHAAYANNNMFDSLEN